MVGFYGRVRRVWGTEAMELRALFWGKLDRGVGRDRSCCWSGFWRFGGFWGKM